MVVVVADRANIAAGRILPGATNEDGEDDRMRSFSVSPRLCGNTNHGDTESRRKEGDEYEP